MAVVRTEYDYAVFHVISRMSIQKIFFLLKDKNYKKDERWARLDEKSMGMTPARFLMGTIFLVNAHLSVFTGLFLYCVFLKSLRMNPYGCNL